MDDIVKQPLPICAGAIRYKLVIFLLSILHGPFLYKALLRITVGQLHTFLCYEAPEVWIYA